MKYGMLRIKTPDGKVREFPLATPSLAVGRAQGNDLILEDASVSRRHAHLRVESGRLMVEDLSSANGTFIGSQRLSPNTPSLMPEDQPLRLGNVELRYTPPPPIESQAFGSAAADVITPIPGRPIAPAGPIVNIALNGPTQPVAPGNATTATLIVQNRGRVVDELSIRIEGLPAEWVRLSTDRVPLLPNAQEQLTIVFLPPRRAEAIASTYPFRVTATSREHRSTAMVKGMLEVLPFQGLALSLQPVRSRRDFALLVHNQGNTSATYRFSGIDDEAVLRFNFKKQSQVTLQPGQRRSIPLRVKSSVRPSGRQETRAFTVTASPTDLSAPEIKTAGQLIVRRPRRWWLALLVLLLLGGLAGGAVFLLTGTPPRVCSIVPALIICPPIHASNSVLCVATGRLPDNNPPPYEWPAGSIWVGAWSFLASDGVSVKQAVLLCRPIQYHEPTYSGNSPPDCIGP